MRKARERQALAGPLAGWIAIIGSVSLTALLFTRVLDLEVLGLAAPEGAAAGTVLAGRWGAALGCVLVLGLCGSVLLLSTLVCALLRNQRLSRRYAAMLYGRPIVVVLHLLYPAGLLFGLLLLAFGGERIGAVGLGLLGAWTAIGAGALLPYLGWLARDPEPELLDDMVSAIGSAVTRCFRRADFSSAAKGRILQRLRDLGAMGQRFVLAGDPQAAGDTLEAYHDIVLEYLDRKDPSQHSWFIIDAAYFAGLPPKALDAVTTSGTWFELACLLEMRNLLRTGPTGTAQFEKRGLAREIPIWDPALCIDCALCALVCPHAAIRIKPYGEGALVGAPAGFPSKSAKAESAGRDRLTVQVAPDDCTGCGICVDVCPARSKEVARHKAIDMSPRLEHLERERANFDHFLRLPEVRRQDVDLDSVQGTQAITPLFEFSGACAGCGETPYLKLMTQVAGDRLLVANATGCSSIFGGNLPTTPWTKGADGRGPAWANSLFEDNAEFGFGMRLALDQQRDTAMLRLRELAGVLGTELVTALIAGSTVDAEGGIDEAGVAAQRERVALLRERLLDIPGDSAHDLMALADGLVPKSLWIVGGDGWAYDIGFGGLDHVIASDLDVNIIVLDTGVYSNTGGQASKATPRAAVAKFAAAGKTIRKKDLGLLAVQYGHVYVAQIALGANPKQALRAMREAASYQGPSLILAYSHCIAHGIDMSTAMSHQKDATQAGFWPLWRYDPRLARSGEHPFQLDSKRPTKPFSDFAAKEARFAMLSRAHPETAKELFALAQHDIDDTFHLYEQMAGLEREVSEEVQS